MASQRTAAQAAQDRNKDRTGRFQHGQSQESAKVQLQSADDARKLRDEFLGLNQINSKGHDLTRMAARSYTDKISQHVRETYPTATAVNYTMNHDYENGVIARFSSITDINGNKLEVDEEVFGWRGYSGYTSWVDADTLEELLYREEGAGGENIYRLELDKDSPNFVEPETPDTYARQLRNIQVALGRQAALAETVSRIQMLHGQNPDIDEVTIGTSVNGRPIFTSIVRNGKRFESPDVTGDQKDESGFAWDGWSSALDTQSDYTEIIGNPISTQAASKWVPGMALQ